MSGVEFVWADRSSLRIAVVAVRPVTPFLRRNHASVIHPLAGWAIVAYDFDGHLWVLGTDADGLRNVVTRAKTLATANDARFVDPDSVCGRCGQPVPVDRWYCTGPCQPPTGRRAQTWQERDAKPVLRDPHATGTGIVAWAISSRKLVAADVPSIPSHDGYRLGTRWPTDLTATRTGGQR